MRYLETSVEFHLVFGTSLGGVAAAGVIHQNLSHQFGGHPKEVGAILKLRGALVNEPQKGFMHQRRALEGVTWALRSQIAVGERSQFMVDERNQGLKRFLVALPPLG